MSKVGAVTDSSMIPGRFRSRALHRSSIFVIYVTKILSIKPHCSSTRNLQTYVYPQNILRSSPMKICFPPLTLFGVLVAAVIFEVEVCASFITSSGGVDVAQWFRGWGVVVKVIMIEWLIHLIFGLDRCIFLVVDSDESYRLVRTAGGNENIGIGPKSDFR